MTRSNTLIVRTSIFAALLLCAGATLATPPGGDAATTVAPSPGLKDPKQVKSVPLPTTSTPAAPSNASASADTTVAPTPGPKNPKDVKSIPLPATSSASGRPAGAIPACQNLAVAASCSYKDPTGPVTGRCYLIEADKTKVCMPSQSAH